MTLLCHFIPLGCMQIDDIAGRASCKCDLIVAAVPSDPLHSKYVKSEHAKDRSEGLYATTKTYL